MVTLAEWISAVDGYVAAALPGKCAQDLALFNARAMYRAGWDAEAWADTLIGFTKRAEALRAQHAGSLRDQAGRSVRRRT